MHIERTAQYTLREIPEETLIAVQHVLDVAMKPGYSENPSSGFSEVQREEWNRVLQVRDMIATILR
jgi:hypothetical protein